MDTPMPTMDIMASVLLMLSPRLMLILTFSMEVMDILDMPDTTDIPMPTMDIMASVLLMPSPSRHIHHRDIHSIHGIPNVLVHILHREGRGQHQPWAWPQAQQWQQRPKGQWQMFSSS